MATTTFYPNAGGEGYVRNYGESWSTIRSAATGYEANSDTSNIQIHSTVTLFASNVYYISRAFLPFDTSAIPDGDVIESVQLKIAVGSTSDNTNGLIGLVQSTQASNTALTTADYDAIGSTEGATRIDIDSAGWKTFTLNSTGRGWISKTGYTKLGIRTSLDLDDTTPTDDSNETSFTFFSRDYNISYCPRLIVTHWGQDRYWVGGTGNWSDRDNWSDSSGGTGGAPVPTFSNDVYFDANSFDAASQVITVDIYSYCKNMDWTGATNTPDIAGSSTLFIYGALTTIAAMTWSHSNWLYLESTGTHNFTANSISFACKLVFSGVGSTWTLQDALTTTNILYLNNGTLNTNGQTVTCAGFYSSYSVARTLTLGASTFNCSGNWWMSTTTNLTLNENTSTINMTGNNQTFDGGGETYNDVIFSGDNQTITGSNTFADLEFTANKQINLTSSTTQTVTTLTATGTSGNLITIHATVAGTAATISDTAGTNTCDYLSLKDITVTGGATFNPGDNSIDEGGNTGWQNAWTNPTDAYSSNDTYATHTSPNGKLFVKLSKDGGTTWQEVQEVTHTGTEAEKTFGDGATELWGTTWVGSDVHDANFRVRIYAGSANSFNWVDFYDFAFDGEIGAAKKITGIRVITEAKWDGTTTSLDHIKVRVYGGDSPIEIGDGSLAYDTTGDSPVFFETGAAAWKKLINEDDAATTSVKGIASFNAADFTSSAGAISKRFAGCTVYLSSAQTIGDSTYTALNFGAELEDSDSFHSTASNTSRITIPTGFDGKYIFFAHVAFAYHATGIRVIRFKKNGAATYYAYATTNATGSNTVTVIHSQSPVLDLNATDYIEIQVYQDTGGNLDVNNALSLTSFSCLKVG